MKEARHQDDFWNVCLTTLMEMKEKVASKIRAPHPEAV